MSPIEFKNPGDRFFVKINAHGFHQLKTPRKNLNGEMQTQIEKFDVLNLETGEEQNMWVDGGLRGQFSAIGGPEKAVGQSFEISWLGKQEVEIEGQKTPVNKYDVFSIDA